MQILELKNLSKNFMGLRALSGVSLEVREGEIFGLIGPNGSGKTTCFNLVTGFLKPSAGSITYKDETITGLEPFQIAEKGIIRTFQAVRLFPNLTVENNIIIGRHLKTKANFCGALFRSRKHRDEEARLLDKTSSLLDLLELKDRRDTPAKNLPLGEERKLEIAIALAAEPTLLLLDEPAAGMNPQESVKLIQFIRSIQKMGITVLIVEHDMRVVMEVCDRIAVLNQGCKIAEGSPEMIANNETVISVYLGRKNDNA